MEWSAFFSFFNNRFNHINAYIFNSQKSEANSLAGAAFRRQPARGEARFRRHDREIFKTFIDIRSQHFNSGVAAIGHNNANALYIALLGGEQRRYKFLGKIRFQIRGLISDHSVASRVRAIKSVAREWGK